MLLLTTCIDEGAAAARWQRVNFVEAVGSAYRLDTIERDILMCLSADPTVSHPFEQPFIRPDFAFVLSKWIELFGLAESVLTVDDGRLVSAVMDGQYGVRPVAFMEEMPGVLSRWIHLLKWLAWQHWRCSTTTPPARYSGFGGSRASTVQLSRVSACFGSTPSAATSVSCN